MRLFKRLGLKDYISMFLGIVTYIAILFYRAGHFGGEKFNHSITLIVLLTSILYGLVAVAIWGKEYFLRLYLFFMLTAFSFAVLSPFILIGIKVYSYNNKKKELILAKSNKEINFVTDSCDCKKLRYGTFSIGKDTIYRYKTDTGDYYNIKYANFSFVVNAKKIEWINGCEYKINYGINDAYGIYHLGKILNDSCDILVTRKIWNDTKEEYIKMKVISLE